MLVGRWRDPRPGFAGDELSGPGAIFRLSGGEGLWITVRIELGRELDLAADIVFRYLQRLGQALAGRLEWFQSIESTTCRDLDSRRARRLAPSCRATVSPASAGRGPRSRRSHLPGPRAEASDACGPKAELCPPRLQSRSRLPLRQASLDDETWN